VEAALPIKQISESFNSGCSFEACLKRETTLNKEIIKMNFKQSNLRVQMIMAASLLAITPLQASDRVITDKELSDESNTTDWLAYGRTHS
jgi:hypothetical protein